MERIGLSASEVKFCARLYGYANAYWKSKDAVLSSTGTQEYVDVICRQLQRMLVKAGEANNFHLLMMVERLMCNADLRHFQELPSSSQEVDSLPIRIILRTLQEADFQMNEVNEKLRIRDRDVATFHRYSSHTRTVKRDHDREGLPKDAIRSILPSHKTRLENKFKGMDGSSVDELSLIGLRRANIDQAERLYKAMQREALGFNDDSKSREGDTYA